MGQKEGVGHVVFIHHISKCSGPPPLPPILFDQSLTNLLWIHSTAATEFNLCCVSIDRFIQYCHSLPVSLLGHHNQENILPRGDYNGVVDLSVSSFLDLSVFSSLESDTKKILFYSCLPGMVYRHIKLPVTSTGLKQLCKDF